MLKGFVEMLAPDYAEGWVLDTEKPDKELSIIIKYGDKEISRGNAKIERKDLNTCGIENASGFLIKYESIYFTDNLQVLCEYNNQSIPLYVINRIGSNKNGINAIEFIKRKPENIRNDLSKIIEDFLFYSLNKHPSFRIKINNLNDYRLSLEKYNDNFTYASMINELINFGCYDFTNPFYFNGYCDVCNSNQLIYFESIFGLGSEGCWCKNCNLNTRMKLVMSEVLKNYEIGMNVYVSEHITNFFYQIKKKIPNITGSEYAMENINSEIRIEDATKLSFLNDSMDIYISNDVFEHVFDFKKAFNEAARILKAGGKMIFHVPYNNTYLTKIRSKLNDKGNVENLLPPIYHINPVSTQGSLVVNDFGFDIFDHLKEAGFRSYLTINRKNIIEIAT